MSVADLILACQMHANAPIATPRILYLTKNWQYKCVGSPQPRSPQAGNAPWTCATRCARARASSARAAWGRSPGRSARSGPGTSQTAPAAPQEGQPVRPMPPHNAAAARAEDESCHWAVQPPRAAHLCCKRRCCSRMVKQLSSEGLKQFAQPRLKSAMAACHRLPDT